MYFTTWTSELIQTDIWLAVRNRINPFHATDLFDTPWKHQKASASGMKWIKEFKELWKLSLFERKPSITNDFLTITWYSIFQIFFIFVFLINLSASKFMTIIWDALSLKPATWLKRKLLHGCFSRFLSCTNCTKLRKPSQIFLKENHLLISDLFTRTVDLKRESLKKKRLHDTNRYNVKM